MGKMTNKELCRALYTFAESFKEIMPDNKDEGKHVKFGVDIMKRAKKAIKQGDKAIELLKEFAFYCVDESIEDHCAQAVKVQEFLKTTETKEWMEEQIKLSKCNVCERCDCTTFDGNCPSEEEE